MLVFCSFLPRRYHKIIQNLDPNKAHDHVKIGIPMLKVNGSSICKPLEMIFKQCIETGAFHSEWKKISIVPIHKKKKKSTNTEKMTVQFRCYMFVEKF